MLLPSGACAHLDLGTLHAAKIRVQGFCTDHQQQIAHSSVRRIQKCSSGAYQSIGLQVGSADIVERPSPSPCTAV